MDEKDLRKMTATKLREMALQYPSIQGVHAMIKEELITALLKAMEEKGEIAEKKKLEGMEEFIQKKSELKQQIKEIKQQRDKAIKEKDRKMLKQARYKIKKLRRTLRKINPKYQQMAAK